MAQRTISYRIDRWFARHMGGHISIGPVTIFGANAMDWAWSIRTKRWGSICFKPPTYHAGRWHAAYFYLSPNGTPWASTFHRGGDKYGGKQVRLEAEERRKKYGHNFDTDILFPDLYPEVVERYPQYFPKGS